MEIRRVDGDDILNHAQAFCDLLMDSVAGGASVGFLPPLNPVDALVYWDSVREAIIDGSRIVLVALDGDTLLGAVQLGLEMRANGSHRAEVMKLLVDSKARRRGIGTALMEAVEDAASECDRTLLVLDTRQGDASWTLYQKLGYQIGGEIPGYARSANGELHTTVFFFKKI